MSYNSNKIKFCFAFKQFNEKVLKTLSKWKCFITNIQKLVKITAVFEISF